MKFIEKDITIPFSDKKGGDFTLTTTSCIHGNEFSGYQVNQNLYNTFEHGKMNYFPICNVDGFINNSRDHLKFGNLNRNPCSKSKSINFLIEEYVKNSDFHIDLHSWNNRSESFVLIDQVHKDLLDESEKIEKRLKRFCDGVDLPLLVEHKETPHLSRASLTRVNSPAVIVELGEHYMTKEEIEKISKKIINGVKKVKYSNKKPEVKKYKRKYIKCDKRGEIIPYVNEGEIVSKNDSICALKCDGEKIIIKAPEDGWVTAFREDLNNYGMGGEICHFAMNKNINILL